MGANEALAGGDDEAGGGGVAGSITTAGGGGGAAAGAHEGRDTKNRSQAARCVAARKHRASQRSKRAARDVSRGGPGQALGGVGAAGATHPRPPGLSFPDQRSAPVMIVRICRIEGDPKLSSLS